MSLFGGDSAQPSLSPSPSPAPPTPTNEIVEVQNAQQTAQHEIPLDSDDERDSEYDTDDDYENDRPNKFAGPARTWRQYTLADRQVVASLENIEDSDLGAHLYNTHNLKKRMRRPAERLARVEDWHTKDSWLKKGEELLFTNPLGETEMELIPSKIWSAWPLPLDQIQKKEGGVKRPDNDDNAWYIEAAGAEDAGEIMREEILALFLRRAKKQWISRESEEADEDVNKKDTKTNPIKTQADNVKPEGTHSAPASDVEMRDYEDSAVESESKADVEGGRTPTERRGRYRTSQHNGPFKKPVFLADDDDAWQILRPSVDSLLTQVDKLALAVRRSRQNHIGRGAYSDMSGSEFTSDAESSAAGHRTHSRARSARQAAKRTNKTPRSRASSLSKHKEPATKPAPQPLDDDDSASDYHEKSSEESEGTSTSSNHSLPRQKRQPLSQSRRSSDASNAPGISNQIGLMDWSEVLGIASTIGWNSSAVARTAQRCATLFNERMSFRRLDEAPITSTSNQAPSNPLIHYTPSTVPDYEALGIGTNSTPTAAPKRPFFNPGTLRCPHADCWGSQRDFKIPYRTVEHLIRVHGYDPRKNSPGEGDDAMMDGGVHVDGFLQPITAKQGWLGKGRSRSKSVDGKKAGSVVGVKRKKQKTDDIPVVDGGDDDAKPVV